MEIILTAVGMIIVGGFIGGLTNSLAIKMLFRPYEAKYIGKWKVPFTPGVIPKRRNQLATQLGQLVVKHLLTVDSIQLKLQDASLKGIVTTKLEKEIDSFKESPLTIRQLADQYGIPLNATYFKGELAEKVVNHFLRLFEEKKYTPLKQWLDDVISNEDLEKATHFIREKGIIIINKEETNERMMTIIQDYLQSKGFIANMVLSMFSTSDLTNKIQRLMTNYLRSDEGYHWIHQTVISEWGQIKNTEVKKISPFLKKKETKQRIHSFIEEQIDVDHWLDKPIGSILTPFLPKIKERILPKIVEQVFIKLSSSIPTLLKQLEVEKMVEQQVASFPTSRIEELVLSITSKEFKLITYLGAFLGGMIGFIQSIVFILV